MRVNEHTAILGNKVLLVPYEKPHVPTYHEWMQDESLRTLTASEPLDLNEEYAMQIAWRLDHDKLTFIICFPLPSHLALPPVSAISARHHDTPDTMIGDINLFLTPDSSEPLHPSLPSDPAAPAYVVGEVEIMIASLSARRQGRGLAALRCFIAYIKAHLEEILTEYAAGLEPETNGASETGGGQHREVELSYLRVKIGQENQGSIALFEGVGFRRVGGVNYFGEVEMRRNVEWMSDEEGGREVGYTYDVQGNGGGSGGLVKGDV
ncbi:Acetyltransferase (GNAT) domain-containing protein 2 [Elsinoe fawcettii]|nr:Acetyltransferase (GNAT) domain-containing protein 2 [Elsinoe fawcettii]